MSLETLTEKLHENFQVYHISEVTDIKQLEEFEEKLKEFKKTVNEFQEEEIKKSESSKISLFKILTKQELLNSIEKLEIQVSRKKQFLDINYKNNEKLKNQLIDKIKNEDASQLEVFLSNNVIDLNDIFFIDDIEEELLDWINDYKKIDCLKLEVLFNNGLKGNSEVNKNNDILWSAIKKVNVNLIRHLLNYEIDINKTTLAFSEERTKFTPIIGSLLYLYSYCKENQMENIKKSKEIIYLLSNHKKIIIDSESDGPSALYIANACTNTNSSVLTQFLKNKGASKYEYEKFEFKETIIDRLSKSVCFKVIDWTVSTVQAINYLGNVLQEMLPSANTMI